MVSTIAPSLYSHVKLNKFIVSFGSFFLILLLTGCRINHDKAKVKPNTYEDRLTSGLPSAVIRKGGDPIDLEVSVNRTYSGYDSEKIQFASPIQLYDLIVMDGKLELSLSSDCKTIIPNAKPRCSVKIKAGKKEGSRQIKLTSVPSFDQKILNVYTIPEDTKFVASEVTKNNLIDDVFFFVISNSENKKTLAYIDRKRNVNSLGSVPDGAKSVSGAYTPGNGLILITYKNIAATTLINLDGTTKEIKAPIKVDAGSGASGNAFDGNILISYKDEKYMKLINTNGEAVDISRGKKNAADELYKIYSGIDGSLMLSFGKSSSVMTVKPDGESDFLEGLANSTLVMDIYPLNNHRLIHYKDSAIMHLVDRLGDITVIKPIDSAGSSGFIVNSNERILISYVGKGDVNQIEADGSLKKIEGLKGGGEVAGLYLAGRQILIGYNNISGTQLITADGTSEVIDEPASKSDTFKKAYTSNERILITYKKSPEAKLISPKGDITEIPSIGGKNTAEVYEAGGNIVISYESMGDVMLIKPDSTYEQIKALSGKDLQQVRVGGEQMLISYKDIAAQNLITPVGAVKLIQGPEQSTAVHKLQEGFVAKPNSYILTKYEGSDKMQLINPASDVIDVDIGEELSSIGKLIYMSATPQGQVLIDFTQTPKTFLVSPEGRVGSIEPPTDAVISTERYSNTAGNYALILYQGTTTVALLDRWGKVSYIKAPEGVKKTADVLVTATENTVVADGEGYVNTRAAPTGPVTPVMPHIIDQVSFGYGSGSNVTTQIFSDGSFITI